MEGTPPSPPPSLETMSLSDVLAMIQRVQGRFELVRKNEREFARIADRFDGLSELVRARGGDDAGRRRLRSALADMERVLEKHLARKPPGLLGRLTALAKSVALADGLKLELEVSRPLAPPPPSLPPSLPLRKPRPISTTR